MNDNCKIFIGEDFVPYKVVPTDSHKFHLPEKVVVFDLDETLGAFGDLYIVWSGIRHMFPEFKNFESLADLYPECFRFGIFTILEYLYKKKRKKQCQKIFVYTNNQCSGDWVKLVTDYLSLRVRKSYQYHERLSHITTEPLFDQLVCAFKINNKPVEMLRSSHKKSVNDLVKCTLLSKEADVCFVDDVQHTKMKNSRVYYICPRPYYHTMTADDFVSRLLDSSLLQRYRLKRPLLFSSKFWIPWFGNYKRTYYRQRNLKMNVSEDLLVSKQLMYHLKEFMSWKRPSLLNNSTNKAKTQKDKYRKKSKRKTKRKYNH
jgi:hypothetical protein